MKIYFVTRNSYKVDEVKAYFEISKVKEKHGIELSVVGHSLQEILHPDIYVIARAKALEAYKYLGVPCAVEHGGIFIKGLAELPGGIGDIIWRAVGDRMCGFLKEDEARDAIARSVIGYCDGKKVYTFTGETPGHVTKSARGNYNFNWDPIFIPKDGTQTYGEMGSELKRATSQAIKAWNEFLQHLKEHPVI